MSKSTPPPRISDAEWQVMEAVWDDHPVGAQELTEILAPAQGWSAATVKTLLGRLVKKGALAFRQEGKRYLYEPVVAREDCVRLEAHGLVERLFGGQTSPMLEWLVRETPMSEGEIAELQSLLDAKLEKTKRRTPRKGRKGAR